MIDTIHIGLKLVERCVPWQHSRCCFLFFFACLGSHLGTRISVMSGSRGVDTSAPDGGLKSALLKTKVPDELIQFLMDPNGFNPIETLTDFLHFAQNKSDPGPEFEALMNTFTGYKSDDRHGKRNQGRVMAALELARETKDQQQQTLTDQTGDLEAPLGSNIEEDMKARWKLLYNIDPDHITKKLKPSQRSIAFVYRQFQWKQPQLLHIEKLSSVATVKAAEPELKSKLGHVTVLTHEKKFGEPKSPAEYYMGLRLLANTCAWAGSHTVRGADGKDIVYAPLSVNLYYADEVFNHSLKVEVRPLEWMKSRDLKCRAAAVEKMIEGSSQGEALLQSYKDMKIEWGDYERYSDVNSGMAETIRQLTKRLEQFERHYAQNTWNSAGSPAKKFKGDGKGGKNREVPPPPPAHPAQRPGRDSRNSKGDGGKGGGGGKKPLSRYVEILPGGAKRCQDFNSPGGCSSGGPDVACPKGAHRCSLRMENQKACGESHSAVRCTNKHRAYYK